MEALRNMDQKAAHEDVVAPVLAGAALLFALMLISVADALHGSSPVRWAGFALAPILPLAAGLWAYAKSHRELGNWLIGSFLAALLATGLRFAGDLSWLHNWQVWGMMAAMALGLSALFRSGVALCISGLAALGWVWLAYSANPPVDFLWSFLVIATLGLAQARRDDSALGAVIFAGGLIIWTGLSMQAAVVLGALGMVQAGLLAGLFLLTCALLLHAGTKQVAARPSSGLHLGAAVLVLLLAAAIATAFAFSPFAVSSKIADLNQPAYWMWVGACITLVVLALIATVFGGHALHDQAALLVGLILLAFAVLILPGLHLPMWWKAAGAGLLSLAAVWFSVRSFTAQNKQAGIAGLAIWGGTVLLTTSGLASQGQRIALFALFSLVAAGLYVGAERALHK